MIIPNNVPRRLPSISEWCAYVTLAPDDSNRIVLSKGISNLSYLDREGLSNQLKRDECK